MKKKLSLVLSLVMALVLLLSAAVSAAEPVKIDGISDRGIKLKKAKLNSSAEEMIKNGDGYSPTTGRKLKKIKVPDGFTGTAATGVYQPVMVQISNAGNGVGVSGNGKLYTTAPINGSYADVVYECIQKKGGGESRMTMIFSDTIPDYVGFVRSTRLTHTYLRQEWDCAFLTSGYSNADVPSAWKQFGVKEPASPDRTAEDPGLVYVGDYAKVWSKYVYRLAGRQGANSELFMAADIVENIVPKDHVPANHTWLFSKKLPEGGDSGKNIYVIYGNKAESDSRLEYDPDLNAYIRYVTVAKNQEAPYRDSRLENPTFKREKDDEGNTTVKVQGKRYEDQLITFSNVIIQGIHMKWLGSDRPDPQLLGRGNADYFMGGKHYAGVWRRTDWNSRTVFYGPNGKEIKLQPGRTLIILMPYQESTQGIDVIQESETCMVKYE